MAGCRMFTLFEHLLSVLSSSSFRVFRLYLARGFVFAKPGKTQIQMVDIKACDSLDNP